MFKLISKKKLFLATFALSSLALVFPAHGMHKVYDAIKLALCCASSAAEMEECQEDKNIKYSLINNNEVGDLNNKPKEGFFDVLPYPDYRDLKKVTTALKNKEVGDSINRANEYGETPLYLAVHDTAVLNHSLDLVKLLLENGANDSINQATKNGFTPLSIAVCHGRQELTRLLLENGASKSLHIATKWTATLPIHEAVLKDNIALVKLLLEYGALNSINKSNKDDQTALYSAIDRECEKMVKLLIYVGADVTKKIKGLEPHNKTIAHLIKNPKDVRDYCSKKELTEFNEIIKIARLAQEKSCNHGFDFLKGQKMLEYDFGIKYNNN